MTALRPTAIGSFAEHRWPVWVIEASVVLKKFRGVVLMVTRWIPNPKLAVRIRSPLPILGEYATRCGSGL